MGAYDKAVNGVLGLDSAQEMAEDYLSGDGTLHEKSNSLKPQLSHLNPSKFAVVLRNVAIITSKSSFLLTIASTCAIFSKICIKAFIV